MAAQCPLQVKRRHRRALGPLLLAHPKRTFSRHCGTSAWSLRNRSQGPVEDAALCGDGATAPLEDIRCKKIQGCSFRVPIRANIAPCSRCNISFVPFEGTQFWASHPDTPGASL
jgi:hypothetical protein